MLKFELDVRAPVKSDHLLGEQHPFGLLPYQSYFRSSEQVPPHCRLIAAVSTPWSRLIRKT
jgi:hypothetical protein